MGEEILEIKAKLRQMRSENRIIATENRHLYAQINMIEKSIQELAAKRESELVDYTDRMKLLKNEIDREYLQRSQQRKDRRRAILVDIRKQTQLNKDLSSEIQSLQAEIDRMNDIHEVFPMRLSSPSPRTHR